MHPLKSCQLKRGRSPLAVGKCATCGGKFDVWRVWQAYCSSRCRSQHFYLRRKAELDRLRKLDNEKPPAG